MKIVVNLLACIAAIFLVGYILPDQVQYANISVVLASGAILWLINTLIRPILKLIALPLTVLTLGLFSLVLNTLMVMLTDYLVPGISFGGFMPSLLLALMVSILQVILSKVFKEGKKK